MEENYECINGLQKYWLYKCLCKYTFIKNNLTGDVPLLPVFKFHRAREWTTWTLCLDPSNLSRVPSIFAFSKHAPWAACSVSFLSINPWQYGDDSSGLIGNCPGGSRAAGSRALKVIFLSYNVLILLIITSIK